MTLLKLTTDSNGNELKVEYQRIKKPRLNEDGFIIHYYLNQQLKVIVSYPLNITVVEVFEDIDVYFTIIL